MCRRVDDVGHVMFECNAWIVMRSECLKSLEEKGLSFEMEDLLSVYGFEILRTLAGDIMRVK